MPFPRYKHSPSRFHAMAFEPLRNLRVARVAFIALADFKHEGAGGDYILLNQRVFALFNEEEYFIFDLIRHSGGFGCAVFPAPR